MHKWIFLIFIFLIGIIVFYGTGPVNAQCPPVPTACNLYDAKGSLTGYSLEILPENNVWPIPDSAGLKWLYKLNGLNSIQPNGYLAPNCCPATTYKTDGGAQVLEPGLGDPTTKFGLGDYQDWVIRLAAVSGQPQYYYFTDKLVPNQKTTVQIKSGNNLYYCKAIAGPGCPGEWTSIAVATNETITLDNGDVVCLKRHPLYPCPIGGGLHDRRRAGIKTYSGSFTSECSEQSRLRGGPLCRGSGAGLSKSCFALSD